jgi:hypothetical protein
MAELRRTGYAKRLWDAWKDYEKDHGDLSAVRLAALVAARIRRPFDDTKLSKIHRGKRRATVDEHYALAAELKVDPDRLAGQKGSAHIPIEEDATEPAPRPSSLQKGKRA